jgi:hypothetical protein
LGFFKKKKKTIIRQGDSNYGTLPIKGIIQYQLVVGCNANKINLKINSLGWTTTLYLTMLRVILNSLPKKKKKKLAFKAELVHYHDDDLM